MEAKDGATVNWLAKMVDLSWEKHGLLDEHCLSKMKKKAASVKAGTHVLRNKI